MDNSKKPVPNKQEFVVMSVDGYKKLAGIDNSGRNLYWTTDINTEIPIRFNLQTPDGDILFPKTLPQYFLENLEMYPDVPCCHAEPAPGKWQFWTWKDCWNICFSFAKSCVAYGLSKRSAVNIIGFNCPEWIWAFHGAIMADMISVGVYTTNTPGACQYVAEHSSAEMIVAENEKQLNKYLEILDELPKLKIIIVYGDTKINKKSERVVSVFFP